MFLSGMVGTGKSEVIKAFVDFAEQISLSLQWIFDTNVIKITALTGTAACKIPNGRTLHSVACINTTITNDQKKLWNSTKILIVDEVSFLDTITIEKLDKNMRLLKNINELYGGIHIVFVGDFFSVVSSRTWILSCNKRNYTAWSN